MSAYLVEDEHVKQLAAFACNGDQSDLQHLARWHGGDAFSHAGHIQANEFATYLANVLLAENYRSLAAKYDDDDKPHAVIVTTGEVMRMATVPAVKIFLPLQCFEYQACESEDWEQTDAYKLCDAIRRIAMKRLPEYGDGNWGAPVEFDKPAAEVISISSMMR